MVGGQTDTVFYNRTGGKHRFAMLCKKFVFNCVKGGGAISPPKPIKTNRVVLIHCTEGNKDFGTKMTFPPLDTQYTLFE